MPDLVEATWPDADVAWQGVFEGDLRWSISHGVHVFVFNDVEALRRACGDAEAGAHSITYRKPDSAGVGAIVMLAQPVTLSAIVHEVTHVGLFWARGTTRRKQRAFNFLSHHTEYLPELISNLSSVLWFSLPQDLLEPLGVEPADSD